MSLKIGVVDEAFKYYTGIFFDSSKIKINNCPEELWDRYPDRFVVPYGRDAFKEKHIDLISAKNDWAAFQLILNSPKNYVLTIADGMYLSPRVGFTTYRIKPWCENTAIDFELNIEEMTEDDDRTLKCDALLRQDSKEYLANEISVIWAEAKIPKEIEAGVYKGGLKIYESSHIGDEIFAGEVTFELCVKNVVLKDKAQTRFELDLWQHNSNIARKYEVVRFSDEHFFIIEEYIKSLALLGQKCVSIIASDVPWAGQTCHRVTSDLADMYEYNMVKIIKNDNQFFYDFSIMQRYIDICFKYGIDKIIKVFGLVNVWQDPEYGFGHPAKDYPDGVKIRYIDMTDGCAKIMTKAFEIDEYIKAIYLYFKEKNLLSKVLLAADEPLDYEYYSAIVERVKKIAPEFRFFAAINHTSHIEKCKDDTDSFCIILPSVGESFDELTEYKRLYKKTYTWYVCCGPAYPNMFLSSHLLETRLVGFLTKYLDLDGFLRWNYTVWNKEPRKRLSYHVFKAGDTNFVYPGNDGKPLLSLRYKQLKRAVEDYLLIEQLEEKLNGNTAEILNNIWQALFKVLDKKELLKSDKTASDVFNLEYEAFQKAKLAILNELERN